MTTKLLRPTPIALAVRQALPRSQGSLYFDPCFIQHWILASRWDHGDYVSVGPYTDLHIPHKRVP